MTPPVTIFVQPPALVPIDQNDPMDLSISKRSKKPFTPEKKNPRFDNNFCFYCGKPGHRIMDHKITTQQVNFVTPTPTITSPAKTPSIIETPPQQQKNV